jgi:hypothetical protein
LLEIAIRRGDNPDVDSNGLTAAHWLELVLLQGPQQLDLGLERELADFIEEQRAAVGQFQFALLVAVGAGEAALDVPEQLGFEQGLRQAGANRPRTSPTIQKAPGFDVRSLRPAFRYKSHTPLASLVDVSL